MEPLMTANTAVAGANMAVFGILVAVFFGTYLRTRAQLPLGMIFFAALLFVHNAITVYAYFDMMPLYAAALLPYMLAIYVAELAGVLVLLRVSLQ